MAVSIKDVAARAGVSTATVSHVLNSTRTTRALTRERVLTAVHELGYSQNQAARNLARGTSSLLGLIISDIRNPFFPEVTAAFQDQALLHEMDAVILNTNYDTQRMLQSVRRLLGLQVPGVAILTSQIEPAVFDLLSQRKIAAVYLDVGTVSTAVSNIVLNYDRGITQAVEHLVNLGHSRIAYIGGPPNLFSIQRRKRAFLEVGARLGLKTDLILDADFTVAGGYAACGQLFRNASPTAVVAGNDLTAIGIIHWIFDKGLRVPDDLSVVGFDNILLSDYVQPALSTVVVPRAELGKLAFEAILDMLADPELKGREYKLETELLVRQSSAAPRRA